MRTVTVLKNGVAIAHENLPDAVCPSGEFYPAEVPIGWKWNGSGFIEAAIVPQTVTRRQGRQALLLAGLLDQVQPAIDAIEDATERGMAQIYWDDAQSFERQNATLLALASALGLHDSEVDDLFSQAAAL